jgi:putative transposase
MECRYGGHMVFNIEYHFVWVTKYRYHVLQGNVDSNAHNLDAKNFGCPRGKK